MKRNISSIIRVVFTILLIGIALYKAGILNAKGREDFINLLNGINYFYVFGSILLTFILNASSALKWKMLLASREIEISFWRVYAFYNIGKFFNLILPTSMGGDVVRIFQLGQFTGKKHTAAASVIVERFTGLMTLILFATVAVIINAKLFNQNWLTISLGLGVVGIMFISWLVLSQRAYKFIEKYLGSRIKYLSDILTKIDKIRRPVMEYKNDRKAIVWALINSIIFQFLVVLNVWISALAFSSEIDFVTCLVAVPIILFIMNIPLSIGGIGLMEFGFVFTFSLFFISPSLSLSTALLIRAKTILDSVIGGFLYIALNSKNPIIPQIKNSR